MDTKELDTLFLGRGWSFPTTFVKTNREVTMESGEDDIKQSLEILLGTTPGERIMHPDFGCNLKDYLFQPMSTTLKSIVQDIVKTAIVKFEARIDLLSINLNTEQELDGVLLIEINYTVRATNSRSNYVYPFYLEEGTNT
ncbi:MAG: GPW/gp25 family protein [Crocinitomicaceae bacterium]|nr:GPW/gp25 family protein [Crocinitomicaceae bacterium]